MTNQYSFLENCSPTLNQTVFYNTLHPPDKDFWFTVTPVLLCHSTHTPFGHSGHLSHDYFIKYAYFVKWYLERFAFVSDPEKGTTYVA